MTTSNQTMALRGLGICALVYMYSVNETIRLSERNGVACMEIVSQPHRKTPFQKRMDKVLFGGTYVVGICTMCTVCLYPFMLN